MKEVELLFRMNEEIASNLRFKLKNNFVKKVREIDTYFYPPHKDYNVSVNGRENLRVRDSGDKKELTYKKVFYDKGVYTHSIEKNIPVSDTFVLIDLLETLEFRKHFVLKKEREVYKDGDFKITIDDVLGLGLFAEIEWIGPEGNEIDLQKNCFNKALSLGLSKVQDKGYLRLLEEKDFKQVITKEEL